MSAPGTLSLRLLPLLGAMLVAGGAHAEGGGRAISLDALGAKAFPRNAPALVLPSARSEVIYPKTAVEHRYGPGGATGWAGFLCGLQPGGGKSGASAAYGDDPHGRFVGAKVTLAFN